MYVQSKRIILKEYLYCDFGLDIKQKKFQLL